MATDIETLATELSDKANVISIDAKVTQSEIDEILDIVKQLSGYVESTGKIFSGATLFNTDKQLPVSINPDLKENSVVDFRETGTSNLSIVAKTKVVPGSIRFSIDGTIVKVENTSPFSLNGRTGSVIHPKSLGVGQ